MYLYLPSVCNHGKDDKSPFTILLCFSSSLWKSEELLLDFILIKRFLGPDLVWGCTEARQSGKQKQKGKPAGRLLQWRGERAGGRNGVGVEM